ncbi:urea carboxylase [Fusarium flagelliforme]|uniref:Urea carboxylase n=1 Tax=Fusarium flagelliforme TaxID=2675880 RepID=A0A395N4X8_9HYPO|nr:urea carboxylase [Fusarium flagelliforme]
MEHLHTVLISNRGEIACRLIKAASKLGIRTIAIYTPQDSASLHVRAASEAVELHGPAKSAYLDGDQIIEIAKKYGSQAIIPGYGFLSENTAFARAVAEAGMVFIGPSPEAIDSFGLKHTARTLALKAGVPVVPGSQELLQSEDDAAATASSLGYPVMLKATAGGGGMGLLICADESEVRTNFRTVKSRGASLFKNAGVFLERYYPDSHHIEVQVFGNGKGKAISVGERECSIQRRHQKVIEECPSPFVMTHPKLRQDLTSCAIRLAESINYGSAGTVEYLVDDASGDFFFLEMNTRLQVEHGITELCYEVDLVELMYRQADREIGGSGGLSPEELSVLQTRCLEPKGHAIEARVYAENPAKDYEPSPGMLQEVCWYESEGTRVDTWIRAGMTISPDYDPLLAKVMHHASTREDAVAGLEEALSKSNICGPPVNVEFLVAILQDDTYRKGNTITKFLETFNFVPAAIDIRSGGAYTLVQDYPGRPSVGHGFGHCGPMDPVAFQAANILVGNDVGVEGLEITLDGPDMVFLSDAIVAICGPPVPLQLDGASVSQWTRLHIKSGQRLTIGRLSSHCRAYLAVYGGFTNVAKWYNSKATNPLANVGGYQGRPLRTGDFLRILDSSELPAFQEVSIPVHLRPTYTEDWTLRVMSGPYETGYLTPEYIETLYSTSWEVSHNAARGGIRLLGPRPEFARANGGEGGAHPSNVVEYGYPIGGLNFTGDEPVILPVDCPDLGGFICNLTVTKADMWKLGQLRSGDKVRFQRVSIDTAVDLNRGNQNFIQQLSSCIKGGSWTGAAPLENAAVSEQVSNEPADLLKVISPHSGRPKVSYRGGADSYILVEYGEGGFDLNMTCRASRLKAALEQSQGQGQKSSIVNMVSCASSLAVFYDSLRESRDSMLARLVEAEEQLDGVGDVKIPVRRFKLPVAFSHAKLTDCIERYMLTQRSIAAYLPDPVKFVADHNGLTPEELKKTILKAESIIFAVGFVMALPVLIPIDPRLRLNSPKMNPSRTFTPEGCLTMGGSSFSIYPVDGPGGYMPVAMTMPCLDLFASKHGFSKAEPWLFRPLDMITFYEVTEDEYDAKLRDFKRGIYEFDVEDAVFDLAAHNKLLKETSDDIQRLKEYRAPHREATVALEKELVEKWHESKMTTDAQKDGTEVLLQDPNMEIVESPINANVWKVLVKDGDVVKAGQSLVILEAMKMEVHVKADSRFVGNTIERVWTVPSETNLSSPAQAPSDSGNNSPASASESESDHETQQEQDQGQEPSISADMDTTEDVGDGPSNNLVEEPASDGSDQLARTALARFFNDHVDTEWWQIFQTSDNFRIAYIGTNASNMAHLLGLRHFHRTLGCQQSQSPLPSGFPGGLQVGTGVDAWMSASGFRFEDPVQPASAGTGGSGGTYRPSDPSMFPNHGVCFGDNSIGQSGASYQPPLHYPFPPIRPLKPWKPSPFVSLHPSQDPAQDLSMFPAQEVRDALLLAYFKHIHPLYPIIPMSVFLKPDGKLQNKPPLLLFQAVLLAGAHVCTHPLVAKDRLVVKNVLFRRASMLFHLRHETARLQLAQAAVLFTWHVSDGDTVASGPWYWNGIAMRIALGLGLHRADKHLPVVDRIINKRLWWSIFIAEAFCALETGRPSSIQAHDFDQEMLREDDFIDEQDTELAQGDSEKESRNMLLRHHLCMAELAIIILDVLELNSPVPRRKFDIASINSKLAVWALRSNCALDAQSDDFCTNHLRIHYNLVTMHLNRRIEGHTSLGGRDVCSMAAETILSSLDRIVKLGEIRRCHFSTLGAVTAAGIQLVQDLRVAVISQSFITAVGLSQRLSQLISHGDSLAEYWPNATAVTSVFSQLRHEYEQHISAGLNQAQSVDATIESPDWNSLFASINVPAYWSLADHEWLGNTNLSEFSEDPSGNLNNVRPGA